MTTLWICSPVFYDVKSFTEIRLRTLIEFNKLSDLGISQLRFVVADDSAGFDPEITKLKNHDDTEILTMPVNSGHQKAIVAALRSIAGKVKSTDFIVTMDGDGEDDPKDVSRLLGALQSNIGSQIVLAKRTTRSENFQFKVMYRFFRNFFNLMTGTKIISGNFALQTAKNLERTIFRSSFDLCYSSSLVALNPGLLYLPCARSKRYEGQSKMNRYSLIAHGIRMLMPFWERISVRLLVFAVMTFSITTSISFVLFSFTNVDFIVIGFLQLLGLTLSLTTLLSSIVLFAVFSDVDKNRS